MSEFLDALLYGYRFVYSASVPLPERNKVNFLGNVLIVDNPGTESTDITFTSSGAVNLSDPFATTGVLADAKQAAQTMAGDVNGTTAAAAVVNITGDGSSVVQNHARTWYDASFPNNPIVTFRGTVKALSGGAGAVIVAIPILPNLTYLVEAWITAYGNGSNAATYHFQQSRVTAGGVVTTLGADEADSKVLGDAAASLSWPGGAPGILNVIGGPVATVDVVYSAIVRAQVSGPTP